ETGIEPATSSLGSWRSTAELLPLTTVAEPRLPPIQGQLQCRAILKHAGITRASTDKLVCFGERHCDRLRTAHGKTVARSGPARAKTRSTKFKRIAIPAAIAGSS